jgi:hypothetical protein
MELAGTLMLAGRSARALARIALDGASERLGGQSLGGVLPRTREQLACPEAVNGLLSRYPGEAAEGLPRLRGVSLPGVDFESSNCVNFLIDLEFEETGDALPTSAYVKLPCRELTTRVFANALGFWQLEVLFCRRIAPRIPIRVPRVYAAALRGSRFVLILENLRELPGAKLFINRDMAAGTTLERAHSVLEMFAELHAGFWGLEQKSRDALLPLAMHTYASPRRAAMTRSLNAASIDGCLKKAPDRFDSALAEVCRRAVGQKWDALRRTWYEGPLTLIHDDSHLGNVFEYATSDGPKMGMLDFQAVQWSKGIRDVQYFLINSLEPELLADHERSLVDFYSEALERQGVSLDRDEAFFQYRAFSFQTLSTAVVALGLGPLTERNATVDAVLQRSVAAAERLEFAALLDAL